MAPWGRWWDPGSRSHRLRLFERRLHVARTTIKPFWEPTAIFPELRLYDRPDLRRHRIEEGALRQFEPAASRLQKNTGRDETRPTAPEVRPRPPKARRVPTAVVYPGVMLLGAGELQATTPPAGERELLWVPVELPNAPTAATGTAGMPSSREADLDGF